MKIIRECDMFPAVKAWLEADGYKVFAEQWGHDVMAIREADRRTVCVEMKLRANRTLLYQCNRASIKVDAVYAAVPRMPKPEWMQDIVRFKMGLLVVSGGVVKVIREPERRCDQGRHDMIAEKLMRWTPDDRRTGGVPTLPGEGDAQRVLRAVEDYQAAHPGCSWKEIWRDVQNHYAHHKSMRQALMAAKLRNANWRVEGEVVEQERA